MKKRTQKLIFGIAFTTGLFLLLGCDSPVAFLSQDEQDPSADLLGGTLIAVTETFIQDQFTGKYDFLWVVDNSGSMSNIHAFMRQQLAVFGEVLSSRRDLDWQMAVTDTAFHDHGGALIPADNGAVIIRNDDNNLTEKWQQMIDGIQGSPNSGWEEGLESSYAALNNSGHLFSRPGTPLIITYISDEEDYSCDRTQPGCNSGGGVPENSNNWTALPVERYSDRLRAHRDALGADVIVYPIVHLTEPNTVDCVDDYGFAGTRYMRLQELLGTGKSLSICENNLADSFNQVAQLTANLGVCFTLGQPVGDSSLIEVTVNGEPRSDFVFEAAGNQICFSAEADIPINGDEIVVNYYTPEI